MSKIDVVTVGNGTAYVDIPDPFDGETVTLQCDPDTDEQLLDIEAWDANGYSIALYVQPTQTFLWDDTWISMTIKVTFSVPKINIYITGDGTASVDDDHPDTGDTVTLTITPDPRRKIESVIAYDENGNLIQLQNATTQTFTWNYDSMDIYITFVKKGLPHRMPIWMYPYLRV